MADARACARVRYKLMRRYPGVHVDVRFNDHVADGHGTYRGWWISFESNDPNVLIGYKLTPLQCHFGSSGGNSDLAGVRWSTHGVIDQAARYGVAYHVEEEPGADRRDHALTKTRQALVMRMLKPFIRGTWKPQIA